MRRPAVVLLVLLALLAPARAEARTSSPCFGERCRALNELRAEHGLAPLWQRVKLQRLARSWAEQMAATGWLRHNPSLPAWYGENVGIAPDWHTTFTAFMESPDHRVNMLSPIARSVGIGWAYSAERVWLVVVFAP